MNKVRGQKFDPIDVDQDEQLKEKSQQQKKLQYQANKQALYKAHMGSPFDVLVAVIRTQLPGTEEDKDRILLNRIQRFFSAGSKNIDPEKQYFRKRRQPNYSAQQTIPVPNELILYGVDFLNTRKIKNKFNGLEVKIEWLDDSHSRVVLGNPEDARRWIQINMKDTSENHIKLQNDEEIQIPRGWFELKPYYYNNFERKLWCRYATSYQNQKQINRSNQYYKMQQAKKIFEQSLKSQVTQIKYLEVMRKHNLIDEKKMYERLNRNNKERRGNRYQDSQQRRGTNSYRRNFDRYNDQNRDSWNNRRINRDRENSIENQRQRSRQRSRQKHNQFDNLSIISQASSIRSRPRKQRKLSMSICSRSQKRPIEEEDSYSYILNQNQLELQSNRSLSSSHVLNKLSNLNIDDRQLSIILHKQEQKQQGQQRQDLSYISDNMIINMKKNKQQRNDLSINQSQIKQQQNIQKKANKNPNISLIYLND